MTKLLAELDKIAKENLRSENEDKKRIASIICTILGAYYSGKLAELRDITSYYSKKAIQKQDNEKASLN